MGKEYIFYNAVVTEKDILFLDDDVTEIVFSDQVTSLIFVDQTCRVFFKNPDKLEKITIGKRIYIVDLNVFNFVSRDCKIEIDKMNHYLKIKDGNLLYNNEIIYYGKSPNANKSFVPKVVNNMLVFEKGMAYKIDEMEEINYYITSEQDKIISGHFKRFLNENTTILKFEEKRNFLPRMFNGLKLETIELSDDTEVLENGMFYGVKLDYFKCPKNLKYICDGAFAKAQIDKIILNDSIEFISINVLEYLESKCPDLYLKYDPYKSITDPVKNVLYKNYISSYKTRVQQYSRYSYANMYKRLDFSEFTLFDSYVYFKKSSVIYNNSIKNIYKDVPLYLKFIYKELISNKINDADISYIKDKLLEDDISFNYCFRKDYLDDIKNKIDQKVALNDQDYRKLIFVYNITKTNKLYNEHDVMTYAVNSNNKDFLTFVLRYMNLSQIDVNYYYSLAIINNKSDLFDIFNKYNDKDELFTDQGLCSKINVSIDNSIVEYSLDELLLKAYDANNFAHTILLDNKEEVLLECKLLLGKEYYGINSFKQLLLMFMALNFDEDDYNYYISKTNNHELMAEMILRNKASFKKIKNKDIYDSYEIMLALSIFNDSSIKSFNPILLNDEILMDVIINDSKKIIQYLGELIKNNESIYNRLVNKDVKNRIAFSIGTRYELNMEMYEEKLARKYFDLEELC